MAMKKAAPKKATPAKKVASVKRGSSGDSDAAKAAGQRAQQMRKGNSRESILGYGYKEFTVPSKGPGYNSYPIYVKNSGQNRPAYEAVADGVGTVISRARLLKLMPKSSLPGFKGSKTPPPTGKMKKK